MALAPIARKDNYEAAVFCFKGVYQLSHIKVRSYLDGNLSSKIKGRTLHMKYLNILLDSRAVEMGRRGRSLPPILADQLTLFDIQWDGLCPPHYYVPPPPGFLDLPTALINEVTRLYVLSTY